MIILTVAVLCVIVLYLYSITLDLKQEKEHQKVTSVKLRDMKMALDKSQVKIEQLDRKADTAYQIANNAMLREKREITVHLKRVKTKPKQKTAAPPIAQMGSPKTGLLEKSGIKAKDMAVWT